MTVKKTQLTAIYSCQRMPCTPEDFAEIDRRIADPYTLSGLDRLRVLHQLLGIDFDEDMFDKIIRDYSLDD